MKHSIVQVVLSAIDRDGDGLTDRLYFGDLGSHLPLQMNNTIELQLQTLVSVWCVLANLATTDTGSTRHLEKSTFL